MVTYIYLGEKMAYKTVDSENVTQKCMLGPATLDVHYMQSIKNCEKKNALKTFLTLDTSQPDNHRYYKSFAAPIFQLPSRARNETFH